METKHIPIFAVLILVLILIVFMPWDAVTPEAQVQACAADEACIVSAMQNCSPANFTRAQDGVVTFIAVNGEQDGKCEVFIKNLGSILETPFNGTSMTCMISIGESDIKAIDYDKACSGTMAEVYKDLGELIVEEQGFYKEYGTMCAEGVYLDSDKIHYEVIGISEVEGRSVCQVDMHLTVPEIGTIKLRYMFNRTDDGMKAVFELTGNRTGIKAKCVGETEEYHGSAAAGLFKAPEGDMVNGTYTCYYHFEVIPIGAPIMHVEAFAQEGDDIIVLAITDRASSYDYYF